ncbi:NAD(P)/FAD-dependent oxidoreductase [Parahaliea maris]|uniref:Pyridine nucleotide-disulfide oxidoreductase domain-containing protein 2 n=1 Tax=Parahaliea maris TaxID=2716870 RepID=A0A5C8ZP93_9GAMM|nr:NAD(P)/FAD-dependent oxidoreductase [Parahaliea maris]TXS90308.1 NAD(P)/FAD-dependent oxidoreductase [Parahaliea maris]
MSDYDIVAMGAGHNGLTTAAYLAKAGKKVLLLERNSYAGGGVATQQILTPGYHHDLHSSVHIMIQANPMITSDELELFSKHGMKYKYSEQPHATIFNDQSVLITYKDLDKTCEGIARYSQKDADAYRRFVEIGQSILPMVMPGMYKPQPPLGQLVAMLDSSDEGRMMLDFMQRSSLDIIRQWFEHDKVQMHIARAVSENLQLPDELGTGMGTIMFTALMHTYGVSQPWGGSGKLSESMVKCIEANGGELRYNAEIKRILVSGGKAVGVEMNDGEKIMAKDAVIGSMHPHKLRQFVDGVAEPVLQRAENASLAAFSLFVSHYDLREPIQFRTEDKDVEKAIMLTLCQHESMAELQADFDALKRGEITRRMMFAGNDESKSDPSRVPAGAGMWHSTGFAPYELFEGGSSRWDEFREEYGQMRQEQQSRFVSNLNSDNIIAHKFYTPLDLERNSPNSMVKGDVHGVAPYFYQSVGSRPTADLGQFRVPGIEGLYLVGPSMPPAGGVVGAGRAAAMIMFEDLGMDFNATFDVADDTVSKARARTLAPKDGAMRLFDEQDEELMAVDSIETAGDEVVIRGKTFGTMPLTARLGPGDLRRAIKLALSPAKVWAILGMLFRKD